MKIAVVGCAHGELEDIYETIKLLQQKESFKIDLLICCGDFQASRNEEDLFCMAVPPKYSKICTFYKYYSGEETAPCLTIFIGGNHEASNHLQELPYGGWVAPNIYYMGYAGVINIGGLRIAGLSGIYKSRDYMKGHYEKVPYDENSKRTVYHIRNLDVFRLKQLSDKIDIFLSHDWPLDVAKFGNLNQLLKRKPFFREDIENNQLGSEPCKELLHQLKPCFWFSAHLHCKYAALVKHDDDSVTKFLALDKCLPNRKFLQILDIPCQESSKFEISYDLEWLTILFLTNHLLSIKNCTTFMPGLGNKERYQFTPSDEEKSKVILRFDKDLKIPENFVRTSQPYKQGSAQKSNSKPTARVNPQTIEFCEKLAVDDPVALIAEAQGLNLTFSLEENVNNSTTFIDDSVNEDLSAMSENSSFNKRSNLSLPQPKCNVSDQNNGNVSSDSELDSSSESGNGTGEEEVEMADDDVKSCNSPIRKKLKRRNENLYKDDS